MKQIYNHHFPTPSYLMMSPYAIDISDQSIKFGEFLTTSGGIRLGRYGKEKIPTGIVVSGKIEKERELVSILKKIKDEERISFVRISLPEEQMYIFTITIPLIDRSNIRQTILFQIEDHVPLKADEIIFDYDIIEETKENFVIQVSASSKEVVDSYLNVFKNAGLTPLSFELEAQAISRAITPYGSEEVVMIVDFGATRTGVAIAVSGKVFFATTIALGGLNLSNMIAKNFSISLEEAENIKCNYGSSNNKEEEDIFPTILNGLSVLRDELNKQLSYWENRQEFGLNKKITKIILCGGDSNLSGLAEYLEISMKTKVEVANAWVNILNTNQILPEMTIKESLNYTTVLGLALADYPYGKRDIVNVLPWEEKKRIKKIYIARLITVMLNIISTMFIVATILLIPSFFFSKTKERLVENNLAQFNNENHEEEIKNFDAIVQDINKDLAILQGAKINNLVGDNIIKELLEMKTAGISFSQISFVKKDSSSTGSIEIRGKAIDRTALKNFKTVLSKNPNYTNVNLPISDFIERSDLDFLISISLK